MRRAFAWVSVGLATGCFLCSVWACSSSPAGSQFVEETGDSGAPEGGLQFNPDSGGTDPDATQLSTCKPQLPATFAPKWTAPTKASKCSTADLGGWYDACEADLNAQTCKDWLTAHADCGGCIQPTDNSGPIQTFQNGLYLLLNVAGCLSIVEKSLGESDSCAQAYDAYFQCRRASCDNCFVGANQGAAQALKDFNTCESNASCDLYKSAESSACTSTSFNYKDADGGAPQCFPMGQESPNAKTFYVRVMGITCGP